MTARDLTQRLLDGNQRFVAGHGTAYMGFRADLTEGQQPFAVIVGCSDSRVPAEIVFDVGLGDLFVVRVAGNVVAPSQIGSVEFAIAKFGTRLVVVMGHTRCGAVQATLDTFAGDVPGSRNLASITDRIAPNIRECADKPGPDQLTQCVTANVRATVNHLRYGSRLLEAEMLNGRLAIVGALYAVETGNVTLLD